jgi:hypothetical protein
VLLVGLLAGIGFTMSIFVGGLAFADASLLGAAKLGILAGSAMAPCWDWAMALPCASVSSSPERHDTPPEIKGQPCKGLTFFMPQSSARKVSGKCRATEFLCRPG